MGPGERTDTKLPFFYGWIIVGLAFLSTGVWASMRTTFSVLFVALLEEFRWSRAGGAGVQSLAFVVYTVTAPAVGALIDRLGPRRVILPGIVLLSTGLCLSSRVQSLGQFYVFYGLLVALGVTFVSIVAYSAILAHWFERRRGTASGIAVSGMGLLTFVLVPLTQYVIDRAGWRTAFLVLGVLVFVLLFPASAAFLRHKPQDMHLLPDGPAPVSGPTKGLRIIDHDWAQTEWTLSRAAREGRFWALLAFAFLGIIPVYMLVIHAARFLVDCGFPRMTAAVMIALVGVISSGFRILWGWLSDRVGREKTFTAGAGCLAAAALCLVGLRDAQLPLPAYLFVLFFGAGWGATAPTFMSVSADLFQGRSFGLIYGVTEAVIGLGSAIGPWLGGFMFDWQQSYRPAFLVAAGLSALSSGVVWLAAPRKVRSV
ncbi:MAG TPA: MFS transporter [Candidatus Methylomirabilis sp.]|nr:MFS transporter [Candidatus Methylomirabilis sp.]